MFEFLSTWIAGANGQVSSSEVGFPVDRRIASNAKNEAQSLSRLTGSVSKEGVIHETELASQAEATSKLVAQMVQARARRMRAVAAVYGSHAQHASNVMGTAQAIARTEARHGKAIMNHDLMMGTQKAEVTGYQKAMQNAWSLVD